MAFENIGIGGVLSFDSRQAVSNMGMASRAFGSLQSSAARFGAGVSNISQGFAKLSFGGSLMAALGGITIGGLVREGINFNKEMESSSLAIATIMATVTKTPLEKNIGLAADAMDRLNVLAAEAPGETSDLVGIFQLLAGPVLAAGGDMETLLNNTKGTAILAGVLKRSFNDTGATISKALAGSAEAGNDIVIMLRSMGLLTETTQEWKALLPEQRLARMQQILGSFAESGEKVGQTFEAQYSTIQSIAKVLLGSFTKEMFHRSSKSMGELAKRFFDNSKAAQAWAAELGGHVADAIDFVIKEVVALGRTVQTIFTRTRLYTSAVTDQLEHWGIVLDNDVIKKAARVAIQFAVITTAISPILAIVGGIGAKLGGIIQIVMGLGQVVSAFLSPPILIVAAVLGAMFLLFRREGETPMQTLGRALKDIELLANRVYNAIYPIFEFLRQAWANLQTTGEKFWAGIQPGVETFRSALTQLWGILLNVINLLAPIIGKIIVGITQVIEAARPGVTAMFNVVAKVFQAVVGALGYLLPKVMAVLGPIVEIIMHIYATIAGVFSKIYEAIAPLLMMIVSIFQQYVVPILGWVIDTFGPYLVEAFQMLSDVIDVIASILGFLIDNMIKPMISFWTWIIDKISGPVMFVFNALGEVFKFIGGILHDFLIEPVKFLISLIEKVIGLIGDAIGAVSDAIGAVGDFLGGNDTHLIGKNGVADTVAKLGDATAPVGPKVTNLGDVQLQKFATDATINAKSQPDVNVSVDVKNKTDLCVDGRKVSAATAKHETEVQERSGFNETPWQTRRVQVSGTRTKK